MKPIRSVILLFAVTTLWGQSGPDAGLAVEKWAGNSRKGKGTISVSNSSQGAPVLDLVGSSQDAIMESSSQKIAVLPGNRYRLNFSWQLLYGEASISVRWKDGGYVFPLSDKQAAWNVFDLSAIEGRRYTNGLGNRTGQSAAKSAILNFPTEVTDITLVATLRGQGTLHLRDFSLVAEPAVSAANQEEAERLKLGEPDAPAPAKPTGNYTLRIDDVALDEAGSPSTDVFPVSATNIRIEGNNFTRDHQPQFLFGMESVVVCPWLYRLLGQDFAHLSDTYPMATLRSKKEGNEFHVWWRDYPWLEAQMRLVLREGVATYVQLIEEKHDKTKGLPFIAERPDLYVHGSHFINWRFEEPLGQRLRQNSLKSFLRLTRRYPIFAYELFNEVKYMDYSPANLASFRSQMKEKYGSIENANQAWGTKFATFEQADPPYKNGGAPGTQLNLRPTGFSVPMWVDWQKCIETIFAEHMAKQARLVKKVDGQPHRYVTIQSVCDLPQGYSGGGGVYPPFKLRAEDFYGDEARGGDYTSQDGGENPAEILAMVQPLMLYDLVSFIARSKPVMDIEVRPKGVGRLPVPNSEVSGLDGPWRFEEDNDDGGVGKGYQNVDFDDSHWAQISVPGMWGREGFPNCSRGWYRKTFSLGSEAPSTIFLNGSQLADTAAIYINGTLVRQTSKWNENFAIDLTPYLFRDRPNQLAVSIRNGNFSNGMFWGGIRGYLRLDDRPYADDVPLTGGQMRSFIWEKLVHGKSGLVMSYAYVPEGDRLAIFNPAKVSFEAIKAIPETKKEIEAVGGVVLDQNRRFDGVALCYPLATGRGLVFRNNEEWLSSPLNQDLVTYYAGLLFSQTPTTVVSVEEILKGSCDQNPAWIFRMNSRVPAALLPKLAAYARAGGVVILDHGSMATDDDSHGPLNTDELAGARVGDVLTASSQIRPCSFFPDGATTVKRVTDGAFGRALHCTTAQPIVFYKDGSAAVTVNKIGKGSIYYIGGELPEPETRSLLTSILRSHGIENQVLALTRAPGENFGAYVEGHLFAKDETRVVYLHNWGQGPVKMILKLKSLPAMDYAIRRVRASESPDRQVVNGHALAQGIPISLDSQDPLILLVEPASQLPLPLAQLSQREVSFIDLLKSRPEGAKRILVNATHGENITKIRMLTAVQLLREMGYEVDSNLKGIAPEVTVFQDKITKKSLGDYPVFMTMGSAIGDRKFSPEEIAALRDYVAAGGGLLIAGNFVEGPHNWQENIGAKGALSSVFGINLTNDNVQDTDHALDGFPFFPIVESADTSPLAEGVSHIQTLGTSVVRPAAPEASVVVRSSATAAPPSAPVMVARTYGKGRVVVMGDAKWLQPEILPLADNARLLENIVKWLAGDDSPALPDGKVKNLIRRDLAE
jgi:uncharacterized membrane protein